ncbi:MAG: hypothetical protein ACP5G4_00460, partial [bacterium]
MKHLLLLFLLISGSVISADSLDCYRESKVDAILRIDKRGYVFETFYGWGEEGHDRDLLNRKFKWAYRDGNAVLLNDAEFLEKLGQEKAAEKMRNLYQDRKKKGNLRMFVGVPLGIAMSTIGVIWLDKNFAMQDPSTLDQAGAVVLGVTG